jgi:hypothetical protein
MNVTSVLSLAVVTRLCRRLFNSGCVAALLWSPLILIAQTRDATVDETAWFEGEWEVTPAPEKGYKDVLVESQGIVRIEHLGGARVARHSPEKNGRPASSVEFTVKKLGENFPWWSDGGGSVLAKKVSEDVFDLASVGPVGKMSGNRVWRHTRVKSEEPAATPASQP